MECVPDARADRTMPPLPSPPSPCAARVERSLQRPRQRLRTVGPLTLPHELRAECRYGIAQQAHGLPVGIGSVCQSGNCGRCRSVCQSGDCGGIEAHPLVCRTGIGNGAGRVTRYGRRRDIDARHAVIADLLRPAVPQRHPARGSERDAAPGRQLGVCQSQRLVVRHSDSLRYDAERRGLAGARRSGSENRGDAFCTRERRTTHQMLTSATAACGEHRSISGEAESGPRIGRS